MLLLAVTSCGARTDLYEEPVDTSGLWTSEINPNGTEPTATGITSVTPPTTTTPIVPPTALPPQTTPPVAPPVTPPVTPITPPDMTLVVIPDPPPPMPCTDADASQPLLRIVIPPSGEPPIPNPSRCGDGIQQIYEQCDDANLTDGDGCASNCTIEAHYACPFPSQACYYVNSCGDGVLSSDEACDDANLVSGDGCSPSCQVEYGFNCRPETQDCVFSAVCGDGFLSPPEQCEVPGTAGCTIDCQVIPGWVCPPESACFTRCGDGIAAGSEQCDDGNRYVGDGCDPWCALEWDFCLFADCPGETATCGNGVVEDGEACEIAESGASCSDQCTLVPTCDADGDCYAYCGDGVLTGLENCDDGNRRDGDGCDGLCDPEFGYACVSQTTEVAVNAGVPPDQGNSSEPPPESVYVKVSVCTPICGDGLQQRGEACDPAAPGGNDGAVCSSFCSVSYYFCGNGVIDGNETCDDGLNLGLDGGCPPGCSQVQYCGDGIVQTALGEECDLGKDYNQGAYGTCTSACRVAARCGDGITQYCGYEECDDGNTSGGDGCTAECQREPGPRPTP